MAPAQKLGHNLLYDGGKRGEKEGKRGKKRGQEGRNRYEERKKQKSVIL